jgi:glycerol-3-phosphate O-acyltransferase
MEKSLDGLSLKERYGPVFKELTKLSRAPARIDETNVYQVANPDTRKMMDAITTENLLPGSRLEGREHFAEFLGHVKAGKRGLILTEHYSNMDLPEMCYLLEHDAEAFGPEISRRIIAISGMKLNEADPLVRAYTESFTRIVIYPSRSLSTVSDPEEAIRGKKINMAAMRALDEARKNRQILLVFPSGTRYRPGKPETKRGLREIDSYLRIFDVMLLVSINGSCLRLSDDDPENMLADKVYRDKIIVTAGPVMECQPFRKAIVDAVDPSGDPKQAAIDRVMEMLESQHEQCEKLRAAEM